MKAQWFRLAAAATPAVFSGIQSAHSADLSGFLYTNGSYVNIAVPGSASTFPYAINDSGEIVGGYYVSGVGAYGFVYSDGMYTTLIPQGGQPLDINDNGDIIGSSGADGFIYRNGAYTALIFPLSINNSDQIIGDYGVSTSIYMQSFLYSDGLYTAIDVPGSLYTNVEAINDYGEIVGSYVNKGSSQAYGFTYIDGVYTTLDIPNGAPTSINDSGEIVGSFGLGSDDYFIYSNGMYTTLSLPGFLANGLFINNSGQIAGSYEAPIPGGPDGGYSIGIYAFIYNDGVYTPINIPGSALVYLDGFNNAGQVVGYSIPLPEPSTWAMMLLGFAGIGYAGYRRRQKLAGAASILGRPQVTECDVSLAH